MFIFDPFHKEPKDYPFFKKVKRFFYLNLPQFSSGAVVYYKDPKDGLIYFLVLHDVREHIDQWVFPKGTMEEADLSQKQRAYEEVKEETGLKVNIMEEIGADKFIFFVDEEKKKISKKVIYFLAETKSTDVDFKRYNDDKTEINGFKGYKFLTFDEAIKLLTHAGSRDILKKADIRISKD